jgi:hypothetical protein
MASEGITPERVADLLTNLDGDWHDGIERHVGAIAHGATLRIMLEDDNGGTEEFVATFHRA